MKFVYHTFVLLLLCHGLAGQETAHGDSSVVRLIKPITSHIYEHKDQTHFLLTSQSLQHETNSGTSITAYVWEGNINRVVTVSQNKYGQIATEWYFDKGHLIFVYQVFEYFDEWKQKGSWQNFKGLYGWESRYYFLKDQLKYQRHKGIETELTIGAEVILADAQRILTYVESQIRK